MKHQRKALFYQPLHPLSSQNTYVYFNFRAPLHHEQYMYLDHLTLDSKK